MKVLKKHLVMLDTPGVSQIAGIKSCIKDEQKIIAIPHNLENVRYLRAIQIKAPSPIHWNYRWSGSYTPLKHQRITSDFVTVYQKAFVLNEMGTMKTHSVLWAADYLIKTKQVRRILIVSPRSTIRTVWGNTIYQHFHHLKFDLLQGSKDERIRRLRRGSQICVINPDGVRTIPEYLATAGFDMVIMDEIAMYGRNHTLTWKALNLIARRAAWIWGMTGTPTPNAPSDAYWQIKLVTPHTMQMSFKQFKELTMRQVTMYKWEPQPEADAIVSQYMRPSIRFAIEDCGLNLPPTSYIDHEVELTPEQAKHYKELLDQSATQIKGVNVYAVNAAVLIAKLIQASCGLIYGENKQLARLDMSNRFKALLEIIDGCAEKIIVFVPFRSVVALLAEKLKKKGYSVAVIDGAVPDGARAKIFNKFQNASRKDLQIIVAHPKTMSHGLTLVAASTIVWYAPFPSNEVYQQANGRIVRPGQTKHTTIVRMAATAVERKVYKQLQEKGRMQQALLDLVQGEWA